MVADGPVIVLPAGREMATLGEQVIIGWKPTWEAGRAVRDALPLLVAATRVTIACISPGEALHSGAEALKGRLARHGIVCEVMHSYRPDRDAGPVLEDEVVAQRADLLVMGACSRSRWREVFLGGATRHLLERTPVPLLMAR